MNNIDYVKLGLPQVGFFGQRRLAASSAPISLLTGQAGDAQIPAFPGYMLYSIPVSTPSWVRLYASNSARTQDAASNRDIFTDPDPSSGVIAEVITQSQNQTIQFGPAIQGYVNDAPVSGQYNIPIRITNRNFATSNISVQALLVKTEDY